MKAGKKLYFGEFLKEKLAVSDEELKKFLNMQEYINEKIGELAIREKLITKEELKDIFDIHKKHLFLSGQNQYCLLMMRR